MSKVHEEKIKQQQLDLEMAEKEMLAGLGYRFDEKIHLHSLDKKPLIGTSTVVNVLAKPLTWWASGLACEKLGWKNSKHYNKEVRLDIAGKKLEEIKNLNSDQFLDLLDEAYKAHSVKLKDSASSGTDLHAELERFAKDQIEKRPFDINNYPEQIHEFIEWSLREVEEFLVSEGHVYSKEMWTGGIVDCVLKLKDGRIGVMDFKSSKESYDSQFIQIAGYDIQLSENGAMNKYGQLIWKPEKPFDFYAVVPFGAKNFTVDMRYNLEELREGFKAALTLHKLINVN